MDGGPFIFKTGSERMEVNDLRFMHLPFSCFERPFRFRLSTNNLLAMGPQSNECAGHSLFWSGKNIFFRLDVSPNAPVVGQGHRPLDPPLGGLCSPRFIIISRFIERAFGDDPSIELRPYFLDSGPLEREMFHAIKI